MYWWKKIHGISYWIDLIRLNLSAQAACDHGWSPGWQPHQKKVNANASILKNLKILKIQMVQIGTSKPKHETININNLLARIHQSSARDGENNRPGLCDASQLSLVTDLFMERGTKCYEATSKHLFRHSNEYEQRLATSSRHHKKKKSAVKLSNPSQGANRNQLWMFVMQSQCGSRIA